MRVTRYFRGRIGRITTKEDELLIKCCWEAAFSSGFDGVILSDLESGVRSYHDELRRLFSVLNEDKSDAGTLRKHNAILIGKGQ